MGLVSATAAACTLGAHLYDPSPLVRWWFAEPLAVWPWSLAGGWALSAVGALGAAAAWRSWARPRLIIAALLLLGTIALIAIDALRLSQGQHGLTAWSRWPVALVIVGSVCVTALAGIATRRSWARWLVLSTGAGGAVAFGATVVANVCDPSRCYVETFPVAILALGSALLALSVGGRVMAAEFQGPDRWWTTASSTARWLHAGVVLHLATVPAILMHGFDGSWFALGIASAMMVGALLAMAGRLAGPVVLALADAALLGLGGSLLLNGINGPLNPVFAVLACAPAPLGLVFMVIALRRPVIDVLREPAPKAGP